MKKVRNWGQIEGELWKCGHNKREIKEFLAEKRNFRNCGFKKSLGIGGRRRGSLGIVGRRRKS